MTIQHCMTPSTNHAIVKSFFFISHFLIPVLNRLWVQCVDDTYCIKSSEWYTPTIEHNVDTAFTCSAGSPARTKLDHILFYCIVRPTSTKQWIYGENILSIRFPKSVSRVLHRIQMFVWHWLVTLVLKQTQNINYAGKLLIVVH